MDTVHATTCGCVKKVVNSQGVNTVAREKASYFLRKRLRAAKLAFGYFIF